MHEALKLQKTQEKLWKLKVLSILYLPKHPQITNHINPNPHHLVLQRISNGE
jgi:hypothetical protein